MSISKTAPKKNDETITRDEAKAPKAPSTPKASTVEKT